VPRFAELATSPEIRYVLEGAQTFATEENFQSALQRKSLVNRHSSGGGASSKSADQTGRLQRPNKAPAVSWSANTEVERKAGGQESSLRFLLKEYLISST